MSSTRILLVDDEPHVIRIMKRVLERVGCAVTEAANGEYAVDQLQSELPDIMVTDIDMPRMNGRELCGWVVKNIPERGFPIVVLTSRAETEHREWAGEIDNLHFMEKPVSMRALTAIVERLGKSDHGQSV